MKAHIDNKEYNYSYLVKKLPTKMFIDGKEIFEDTYLFYPGKYNIKVIHKSNQIVHNLNINLHYTILFHNY